MFPRKLKIDAFLAELDKLGPDAFTLHPYSDHIPVDADKLARLDETTQLYSGPASEIEREIRDAFKAAGFIFYNSWQASRWQAQKRTAKRIDDTVIGKLLIDLELESYFLEAYAGNDKLAYSAIQQSWDYASRKLVEFTHNHLYATSGGAARNRVFCRIELPTAIRKKRHSDINAVPFDNLVKVRGPARRARYAALTGIRLALRDAAKEVAAKSPDAETAVIIYHTQLMSYRMLRRNVLRRAKKKIPAAYKPSADEHIERLQQALVHSSLR